MGELSLPVGTTGQVGTQDRETATGALDHTTNKGSHCKQFSTPCCLINTPQWPHRFCCGLSWLEKIGKMPSVKADLAIYSYIVTMSG